jgi:hypothetical protein
MRKCDEEAVLEADDKLLEGRPKALASNTVEVDAEAPQKRSVHTTTTCRRYL